MKILASILIIAAVGILGATAWFMLSPQENAPGVEGIGGENNTPLFPEPKPNQVLVTEISPKSDQGQQMKTEFQQSMPDGTRFSFETIAVAGEYALAVFVDENVGGTALLKKDVIGNWKVVSTDGGVYNTDLLVAQGVPLSVAVALVGAVE